ncbi:MAG: 4Fe-4S dicluster domain-containing protein [Geobacter sp.]|nr:4Fe-4S dicluster domain-containing protein [Geobacter sp.]
MIRNYLFTILFVGSAGVFAWEIGKRLRLIRLGRPESRFDSIGRRLRSMFLHAFAQDRVLKRPFGINHLVIFWAFMALLLVNAEFMVNGIFPDVRLALLPDPIYLPIRFISDVMALLTLIASVIALFRRTIFPPFREARSLEGYAIIILVALHMVAYLGMNGAEISMFRERGGAAMPVSSFVAMLLGNADVQLLWPIYMGFWWLHAVALFAFVALLVPRTKHLHIMTAIANCFFAREGKPNSLKPEQFAMDEVYGAGRVDRFSWKDLLDSFACASCGRCESACPATTTEKALNPRKVIMEIRNNLLANGSLLKTGGAPQLPLIGEDGTVSVSPEAIWSCTTCGACMEACPVLIEHMPKIIEMRRYLVQMQADFPEELLNLFENMEGRSNPWGIAPSDRGKWAAPVGGRLYEPGRTEYLYYVGCAGSFDSRQKQVTVALATILDAAGVTWGILGKEELCCGDSLRRLGNEYVFDRKARENVKLFKEKGVTKIITQCPHCFSTLKNDYRQYGLEVEVMHQSQLIDKLIREGKISITAKIEWVGKVLFHDSCYLGRHNDVYEEPRHLLQTVTGSAPLEFARTRENAFCCGGGGGRMWLEENTGKRINIERVEEALFKNPDTICVACPYCLTMFEDGLKDRQAKSTRVLDLAEVVAEGLRMSQ